MPVAVATPALIGLSSVALVAIVEAENEKLIAVTGQSKVNLKSLLQQILAQDMACLSLCHTQCKQTKPEESVERREKKKCIKKAETAVKLASPWFACCYYLLLLQLLMRHNMAFIYYN